MKKQKISLYVAGALLTMSGSAQAATEMTFGGYIKADVMFSDYGNGAPDSGSLSRQFYVPDTIYGTTGNGKQVVDFQARESRFNFKTVTDVEGHKLTGFIELDFLTHTDGNERVSNSYSPRIRHAFMSYDNWTVGQTWTTFQNPGALPENLDFVGAAEGTPFVRQSLLRYTSGNWQFSIENPETTVTPLGGGGRITSGSGVVPDVVGRYNFSTANGSALSLAAIVRQIDLEQVVGTTVYDTSELGYGVSFAGVIPVGKDDLKFTATYGEGLGRYMALNYANAGVLDSNGEIQAIKSFGGFVSYRHWWSEQWRSSVTFSGFSADNDVALTGGSVNKEAYSSYVNLLFSPSKPVTFGVEYMYALNEREDGFDGDLNRILFSAKYAI
ncbi:DcaP family trimeric outer membrane transporter [Shewanella psychromarinicola]|uniref:Porin n=1 Tax=Shewanella psychromarinicola TaxID=2487742 RepID=A0A3N4DD07_9GAMM|nr:DcaP family trimeric outer membrane transporter [Shewanella psychromarinicola]AZG35837.1 porin [Shewanella psychromarinicola]MCL1082661.1 DcaP family trimeric outer membrane transporter [Shewanella psychromarinicola]RPA23803.1 porin [Shewanella psychromarinicola]